jgi:hypothetical protein
MHRRLLQVRVRWGLRRLVVVVVLVRLLLLVLLRLRKQRLVMVGCQM